MKTLVPRLVAGCTLVLGLAACGGPTYKVKVIDEPGSGLKGTQKPYEVNGERFEPLANADGYAESGTASWYGPDFHGRKTSNGETYNMNAMTAAHKTLPMNVFVRVINETNGKQSVVRINDRGPFVKGRIIDLSYAAAQEIGMVGGGTAQVRIETLGFREAGPPGSAVTYRQPASYAPGPFTVQVGAFAMPQNAIRLAEELRRSYGDAAVVEGWVSGKLFHRVRVGLYKTLADAEKARIEFEGKGFQNSFVVARD
ncbi:MAG: septal ring lytic transglycosylase RlpA family protein [Deltaproteobacteria bacterium]|nr:MAG: septal ring lytic transglycosylase RlpA family protein [Deltaproteobacteria bacterium]